MDGRLSDVISQANVRRWVLVVALLLPAAAALDTVAQGRDGGAAGTLWHLRAPPSPTGGALLDVRLLQFSGRTSAARRDPCPRPLRGARRHGPRTRRRVALTFDDGPSRYTPAVLRALRRARARATFFVVGVHVARREAVMRRAVTAGDELGDHSWDHPPLPSHWQLRRTADAIRRATGVRPCLFRPPYGLLDRRLRRAAASLRMTTVEWDVDTSDWAGLRPRQIAHHVLRAIRPGSIVLLHDGGGVRVRTVRALPHILRGLSRRGYRPVTVSRLLGR